MKKKIISYITFGLLLFVSCSKDRLVESSPNIIASETLYTSYAGFDAGVNGLYSLVRLTDSELNGFSSLSSDLFKLGTDNLVSNHGVSGFNNITVQWGVNNNPAQTFYQNVFIWLYQIINSANTILESAESTEVDWTGGPKNEIENRQYIEAHAFALRAWAYRHLTYLWGDVPLNLKGSKGSNIVTDWERTPVSDIRKIMIQDWRTALSSLPIEPLPGRISKGAVNHYLAESYLLNQQLDSALYFADQVIQQDAYRLVTERYGVRKDEAGVPFMDLFYEGNTNREEGNTEALWVFQFEKQTVGGGTHSIVKRHHISRYNAIRIDGVNPFQFTVDRGGRGLGRNSLTKFAIDLYEEDDDRGSEFALRKFFILKDADANAPAPADHLPPGYHYGDTIWLDWSQDISPTHKGVVNWPYSRKVEYVDPQSISADHDFKDQVYLRLAETYLLKAEILFKLNRLTEAVDVINIIRLRAQARPITLNELDLDFILDERSRELVMEEERRYTLLRNGKWLERTRLHNKNGGQFITERDALFPIPQVVIDANLTRKMEQNNGY